MDFIKKNMGMITMIAALVAALVLVLPMLGVDLPTREGKAQEDVECMHKAGTGAGGEHGLGFDSCAVKLADMMESEHFGDYFKGWKCDLFSDLQVNPIYYRPITQGAFDGQVLEAELRCRTRLGRGRVMEFSGEVLDAVEYE